MQIDGPQRRPAGPRRVVRRGAVSISAAEESRPKRQLPLRRILHRVLFAVLASGLVWIVVFSGWLDVRGVEVEKGQTLSKESLEEDLDRYLESRPTQRNILFVSTASLEAYIREQHTTLRSVNINRTLFLQLHIKAVESEPAIVWESAGMMWLIGDDGRVLREAQEGDAKLGKVVDTAQLQSKIGDKVTDKSFVSFVRDLNRDLRAKNIQILQIEIGETTQEIRVRLIDGTYIRMATTRGAGEQVQAYIDTRSAAKSSNKPIGEYVDVRVVGKTYYK